MVKWGSVSATTALSGAVARSDVMTWLAGAIGRLVGRTGWPVSLIGRLAPRAIGWLALCATGWVTLCASPASAAAPLLLHTPGYESPTHADPDDLLMIAGWGFDPGDRVVYRAMDTATGSRAGGVPTSNSAAEGIAPIVQQGDPRYAITIRLPTEMKKGRAYRLWVVTAHGEWSEPLAINDPRPQWVSPAYVYSNADLAGLGRVVRVVGRNLRGVEVRLSGPRGTYMLTAAAASTATMRDAHGSALNIDATTGDAHGSVRNVGASVRNGSGMTREGHDTAAGDAARADVVSDYVATASLAAHITPGFYTVSVHRDGLGWVDLPYQKLEVLADPTALPTFTLGDPQFGSCHPDDGADDSACFARAIEAAGSAGGGIVVIPAGRWDLTAQAHSDGTTDGFIIPRHVQLRGAGPDKSRIIRHGPVIARRPDAMLTLTGDNAVSGLGFSDEVHFNALPDSRPVIQLGSTTGAAEVDSQGSHVIKNVVISGNTFLHIGRAITDDAGRPISRLMVTANEFGAYSDAIGLPGNPTTLTEPFRIDDSIVRGNRFVPGSWLDLTVWQGAMATGMGAGYRVDFSANVADGTSTEDLQDPKDPSGWRAGYFWNMNNSVEMTLVSENQVSCSGDKDGDGEAFAFDGSGETFGFNGAPTIEAAGPDWVTVNSELFHQQIGRPIPRDTYYIDHWLKIVDGPGVGQTRRIVSYTEDPTTSKVTFHVAPKWDIPPTRDGGRAVVGRQYWQVYVVGNDIEHRAPPCHKSNLHGPYGGEIAIWTPSADFVIEGNQQHDANGILFAQGYSVRAPSCPTCNNSAFFQTNLEIRGNRIEGEYDWSSDCSEGGIQGTIGASPTPESPPPIVAFGVSISHNVIMHSDGPRGGGIDIPLTSHPGPPPGHWDFMENLLVFHNQIQDMAGPAPSQIGCHRWGQQERSGIRLEGDQNIRDTVLYGNSCARVDKALVDGGLRTRKLCAATADRSSSASTSSCECGATALPARTGN